MSSIYYEIDVILTQSRNCFITAGTANNQVSTFAITDAKVNIYVVTLST